MFLICERKFEMRGEGLLKEREGERELVLPHSALTGCCEDEGPGWGTEGWEGGGKGGGKVMAHRERARERERERRVG